MNGIRFEIQGPHIRIHLGEKWIESIIPYDHEHQYLEMVWFQKFFENINTELEQMPYQIVAIEKPIRFTNDYDQWFFAQSLNEKYDRIIQLLEAPDHE